MEGCTDQTKATASLVIVLVSSIQISGSGENNFVKWKGTFRSDRLDQIRSVSVKGSHSQEARQIEHARRPVGVDCPITRQVFSI